MKKTTVIIVLLLTSNFYTNNISAQDQEIQQLIFNIEKLTQFKQILSDMQKGYQLLEGGYNTVRDISKGNFSLHKAFLDGLLEVSPMVRSYRRIGDIVTDQITLVREYKNAFNRFRSNGYFEPTELSYMAHVYDNLLQESLGNLDELLTIITAGQARMSDDERLRSIDRIYTTMEDKLQFLRQFNNNAAVLAMQRSKEHHEVQLVRKIYGINN